MYKKTRRVINTIYRKITFGKIRFRTVSTDTDSHNIPDRGVIERDSR